MTDIAILVGIYHAVCTTLNLFEIPAPHERHQWGRCQQLDEAQLSTGRRD